MLRFIVVLVCSLLCAAPAAAAGLFGSQEIKGSTLAAFTKWTDMLDRYQWEENRTGRKLPCRLSASFKCRDDEWRNLLTALKTLARSEKINRINGFLNQAPYITDNANYGMADYWATVYEFLRKDGDCEDYAIAKYFSLKALGFDPARMRVVVVEDLNLKTPHAVLALYLDGQTLILDNQLPAPVRAESIVHYRPIYSINETAWWLHRL